MTIRVASRFTGLMVAGICTLLLSSSAHAQEEDLNDCDKNFSEGKFKQAAAACDRAIRKYPKQVPPGAYGKRAAIFIIEKRFEAGRQFIVQKAEPVHPKAPEIQEQKALILWQLGNKIGAVKIADQVVKARPSSFTNQAILCEWYAGLRQAKRAASACSGYLSNRPQELSKNDVLPRVRLGFAYLATGDAAKAQEQFQTVAQRHKNQAHAEVNANNGLCAAYTALGKFDQAISLCEKIINNPRRIDRVGSVWYNLGQAYLAKKQSLKAIQVGKQFVNLRKNEPKGWILLGDAYYQQQQWQEALLNYQAAEKRSKGRSGILAKLGIKMGATYRRLDRPQEAIQMLEKAVATDPQNPTLAGELGAAYLVNGEDDKAFATVDKLLPKQPDNVDLLVIAARSQYNQGKIDKARERFLQAYKANPKEAKIRLGLVQTINYQAYQSMKAKKKDDAVKYLLEARKYVPNSTITNQNLAVLAIESGDCDGALTYLNSLRRSRASGLIYNRLAGRANRCKKSPDLKQAAIHYAAAAKRASGNNLMLAEIYTEWAPLIVNTNLTDATKKLEEAVRYSTRQEGIANAAKRNLALALFRRGWLNMRKRNSAQAVQDFERAARDPNVLRGSEAAAFEFSHALALLNVGDSSNAEKHFKEAAKSGNEKEYLKPPYDKVGAEFFTAYAKYKSGSVSNRKDAAAAFLKMTRGASGSFGRTVRELLASSWEYIAYDYFRTGNTSGATSALATAEKYATSASSKKAIAHNRAVLSMGANAESVFAGMNGNPPESLVNLGIVYDRAGKPKQAYDAWVKASSKGVRSKNLSRWISAKKRIFGY